jgi:hypothetical protein
MQNFRERLSAKIKERLKRTGHKTAEERYADTKTYLLPTDRTVRRRYDQQEAREARKANQAGRRRHAVRQQADHLAEGSTRILTRQFDPAQVSPDLVTNVDRAFLRRLYLQAAQVHPLPSGNQHRLTNEDVLDVESKRREYVNAQLREMGLTHLEVPA